MITTTILPSAINNFSAKNYTPAKIIPNPKFLNSVEVLPLEKIVSNPNARFSAIVNNISNHALCPIPAKPVTILLNPQNQTYSIPNLTYPHYVIGNYYKIPVSDSLSFTGQRLPKYAANIPVPFFGFIYPVSNPNYGYMLVKTLIPLTNIPNDIIIINESQVLSELQTVIQTIFAM